MFSPRKKNVSKLKHEKGVRVATYSKKRSKFLISAFFIESKEICFESRLLFTSNLEDGLTRNSERNYMIPYFNGLSLEQ